MAHPKLSKEKAAEAVSAMDQCNGNQVAAAKLLGIPRATLQVRLRAADLQGLAPKPKAFIHGASILRNGSGEKLLEWTKVDYKRETQEAIQKAFIDALRENVAGISKPVPAPPLNITMLMSAILIGDAHFGMRAFKAETDSSDFDLKIAERELKAAVSYLIQTSPKSKYGMFVDVGDFMHVDNRKQATPNGGNLLDVDTRYQHLCRVVVNTIRYCLDQMLRRYEKVFVILRPGNHNQDSAGWMSLALSMYYENEPRIVIDMTQGEYYYHKFGNNLIGVTHGDKAKFNDLISIMAADRPKEWGETEHRYFWTGHVHHTKQLEFRGGFAESFNTLAPGDAWHAAAGYRSKRQMQRIDLHEQNGIMGRQFCNLGMLDLE